MKPNDHKAYAAYCEKHGLRPSLSAYPQMYFVSSKGKQIKKTMQEIYQDLEWKLNPNTGRWSKPPKQKDGNKRK